MDLNYKTVKIFPVPVHQFDVNGFSEIQDELIDYVYKMREKDPVGHTISNRRGWQSSCFSLENEDDILQNFLTNCLSEFPPIEKSIKLFVSAWININPPEAFNLKHNHPTSDLSGIFSNADNKYTSRRVRIDDAFRYLHASKPKACAAPSNRNARAKQSAGVAL